MIVPTTKKLMVTVSVCLLPMSTKVSALVQPTQNLTVLTLRARLAAHSKLTVKMLKYGLLV